jgi:hypothetical protein
MKQTMFLWTVAGLTSLSFSASAITQAEVRAAFKEVGSPDSPPGESFGDKSHIMSVLAEGDVRFIFVCSAGKENGVGDKLEAAAVAALDKSTNGLTIFLRGSLKRLLKKAIVQNEDAFCGVLATQAGSNKKAKSIRNGSIYTSAWRNGVKIESVTDKKHCKNLDRRYLCFEVAEDPKPKNLEFDGVSGCFQYEVNKSLVVPSRMIT